MIKRLDFSDSFFRVDLGFGEHATDICNESDCRVFDAIRSVSFMFIGGPAYMMSVEMGRHQCWKVGGK